MATLYDASAHYDVRIFDVTYLRHGGTAYPATVYQAQGDGPFPALVNIHGGAWYQGSRLSQALFNTAVAAGGAVVVAIDFRQAPDHPYPAQVADANYGVRWLKAHARELNALPDAVGAMGDSSGAHTMMLNALRPRDPLYAALPLSEDPAADASLAYVISLWGVLDSHVRYEYAKRTGYDRLVRATEQYFGTEELALEANPQTVLDRGRAEVMPPLLIIQGTRDDNIPNEIPERFAERYRKRGGHVELEWFPDMPHQFAKQPGPESERAHALMRRFVERQLATAAARA